MELHFQKYINDIEKLITTDLEDYNETIPTQQQRESAQINHYLIIQSILEGEYYLHSGDDSIVNISAISQRAELHLKILNQKLKKSKLAKLHIAALPIYIKSISLFNELVNLGEETLTTIIKVQRIDFVKELKRQELLQNTPFVKFEDNPYLNLIRVGVSLAVIDMSLSCSRETIDELDSIIKYLGSNKATMINSDLKTQKEILLEKADYLLKKITFRKSRTTITDKLTDLAYWKEYCGKMNYYSGYMSKTISHYLSPSEKILADYCNSFQEPSISAVHAKSKALRQGIVLTSTLKQDLDSLKIDIKNLKKQDKDSNFNQIAYDSADYLLANTEIVILLRDEYIIENLAYDLANKPDAPKLNELFQKINRLYISTNNFDYYLYYQFLVLLNSLIDYLRDNPLKMLPDDWKKIETDKEKSDELREVKSRISSIDKLYSAAYKSFTENFEKWEYRNCSPLYLSSNECILDNKLFLDSSYVLPIDYDFIKNNWVGALEDLMEIYDL